MRDKNQIQSIIKAFNILELFSRENNELRIKDISIALDLPLSTSHRILSNLLELGYISQNQENGKYRLGVNAFILGSNVNHINNLVDISLPLIAFLADKYNCMSHLVVEQNGKVLCVGKIGTVKRDNTTIPARGEVHHMQVTSVGKAILAFLPESRQKSIIDNKIEFKKFTANSILTKEELYKELKTIRKKGYATDNEESEIGLFCYGVPIFNNNFEAQGAISLSIYDSKSPSNYLEIIEDLKRTASFISNIYCANTSNFLNNKK